MSAGMAAGVGPPGGGAGRSSIRKLGAGALTPSAAAIAGMSRQYQRFCPGWFAGVTKLRASPLRGTPTIGAVSGRPPLGVSPWAMKPRSTRMAR